MENEVKKSETALREEETARFWKENKIFEKSIEKPAGLSEATGEYVFYDGPPFATGTPHYGHILASAIKDTVPRYWTMRGYRVPRRWGWDCHGLPIETIVEKTLKISGKKEIEAIGIDKFNETARSKVLEYVGEWKKTVDRMGRWVDFDGSYKTMDNSYIESVWWAISEADKNGLLYEGRKVLMYCTRCETPLSKAEVVMDAGGYRDVTEEAVTVRFKISNPGKIGVSNGTSILAWTTTPWTLPGNVALAVGKDIKYVLVEKGTEDLIVARDRVDAVFGSDAKIVKEFSGEDLVGLEYEPLYDLAAVRDANKKTWRVVPADFVTTTDGTGVVHTAVTYGEDDFRLGQEQGLPVVQLLDQKGHYNEFAPEFVRGLYIKKAEKLIKEDLEKRGLLFKKENNTHSYPHCYRCDTPLIFNAVEAWFLDVQKNKAKVLRTNESIHWVPEHLKEGRYKNIVEGAPDWNISRNRYWASPLPIWKCNKCKSRKVVGSLEELRDGQNKSGNKYFVMRHGQAENNTEGVISCNVKNKHKLTSEGREMVIRSAEKLAHDDIDIIFSSDFLRTKETAELVADEIKIPREQIIFDERLRECNFGEFDMRPTSEYHAAWPILSEKFEKAPEGGETLNELKRRIGDFVYELDTKYSGKNILIVSHEYPLWMLSSAVAGLKKDASVLQRNEAGDFIGYGEVRDLDFVRLPHNANYELDLHRPYIDAIEQLCDCGEVMQRVSEVVDCWIESAGMPFAQVHYPFENKEWFHDHFPAQFVAEYIAQTRTWFYYTHSLSVALFGKIPFEHVVTTGTVLAEDGQKMSKSKGNFPDPWILFNAYGADAMRFYMISSPLMRAEDLCFSERGVRDIWNKVIQRMTNVLSFYEINSDNDSKHANKTLDDWILSRLSETGRSISEAMERYEIDRACAPIESFIEDLSVWYVRRSRKNFSAATTKKVLRDFSMFVAPILPFLAESIWQKVREDNEPESVHLVAYPKFDATSDSVVSGMTKTREIVERALSLRSEQKIRVRQPLSSLSVWNKSFAGLDEGTKDDFFELIRDEVNVKKIIENEADEVVLDTVITPELALEGEFRDLVREIQDARKEAGLMPREGVKISVPESSRKVLETYGDEIRKQTNALEIVVADKIAVLS